MSEALSSQRGTTAFIAAIHVSSTFRVNRSNHVRIKMLWIIIHVVHISSTGFPQKHSIKCVRNFHPVCCNIPEKYIKILPPLQQIGGIRSMSTSDQICAGPRANLPGGPMSTLPPCSAWNAATARPEGLPRPSPSCNARWKTRVSSSPCNSAVRCPSEQSAAGR